MNPTIIETVNVAREVTWLPWAVQYFFLIGLSYGAFLLSLPGVLGRRDNWIGMSRLALLAALICGLTAPVALLADLHQPGRFLHFYQHFSASSWMSWGAFFIPVYLVGLVLYAWLAFRPLLAAQADSGGALAALCRRLAYGGHESRGALLAAALLAFAGAALVALYTGMEVKVVHARPLWNTPLLPLQFVITALAGAIGLVLLLKRCADPGEDAAGVARLGKALALTQALALAVGAAWLLLGLSEASPTHAEALALVMPSTAWKLTAAWAAASTVLTLWLSLHSPGRGVLIGLIALHSAWMMRWTVFIGGQELPKTGAGFYQYDLPLGPDGLLGIVGTAGLWIALYLAITALLPVSRLGGRPA